MNNIDTCKYLEKIKKKNSNKKNKFMLYIKNISERLLLSVLIFLIMAISIKKINGAREFITKKIYTDNISLAKIKNLYDKYLGGIIPFDTKDKNNQMVFKDTLNYKSKSKYLDGVELTVDNKYLVPVIKSGLVVFIGSKDDYNNVIIIQGEDGIDIWYGNMETVSVKLYDYIDAGSLLGEVKDDKLYLVYSKNGEILNYEDYL